MSLNEPIYDLGDLDLAATTPRPQRTRTTAPASRRAATAPPVTRTAAMSVPSESAGALRFNLPGSLSLFLPGAGQLLSREWTLALFFFSSLGFLASFSWALLQTMDSLVPTLVLLGHSRAAGIWMLGGTLALAGLIHLSAILTTGRGEGRYRTHVGLAAAASGVLPGWGQLLNGQRVKATCFVAGLWVCGLAWLLASPPLQELLLRFDLVLPRGLSILASPATRWTAPAVLWALAIYDAAQGSTRR
jgi:hypothetical protein